MHVDGRLVDVQYSNWRNGEPQDGNTQSCVVVTGPNKWLQFDCYQQQKYVCQS